MPEFTAPALGNKPNTVTMEANIPANANGVLYALGGFGGGLTTYIKDGILCYEYNLFEIQRTRFCSQEKIPEGKAVIEVTTAFPVLKPGAPADITIKVNGRVAVQGKVPITAPLLFTANDSFDIGSDTGSPVSLDYFDKAPFAFTGTIEKTHVKYKTAP
jgi:arylsulfatase